MESHADETQQTGTCSLLPRGEPLMGSNLGGSSLVAGVGNEHLLGRPCEHCLCPRVYKKMSLPFMVWVLKGKWIASLWKKRVWSLHGPIFLVLYNSFLCHCLTSVLIMLPGCSALPFYHVEFSLLKTKLLILFPLSVCASVCLSMGTLLWEAWAGGWDFVLTDS